VGIGRDMLGVYKWKKKWIHDLIRAKPGGRTALEPTSIQPRVGSEKNENGATVGSERSDCLTEKERKPRFANGSMGVED